MTKDEEIRMINEKLDFYVMEIFQYLFLLIFLTEVCI